MNKDQFIEKILNSMSGIQNAEPNDSLLSKIQLRIQSEKRVDNYSTWLVAASVVLLVSLNFGILSYTDGTSSSKAAVSELIYTTNNQLY